MTLIDNDQFILTPACGPFSLCSATGEIRRNGKPEDEKVLAHTLPRCSKIDIVIDPSNISHAWIKKHLLGHIPPKNKFYIPTPRDSKIECYIVGNPTGVINCNTQINILTQPPITEDPEIVSSSLHQVLKDASDGFYMVTATDPEKVLKKFSGLIFRAQNLPSTLSDFYNRIRQESTTSTIWCLRPDTWGALSNVQALLRSASVHLPIVALFDILPRDKEWSTMCTPDKIFHLDREILQIKDQKEKLDNFYNRLYYGPERKKQRDQFLPTCAWVECIEIADIIHSAVGDSARAMQTFFEECAFSRPSPCALVLEDVDELLTPCEDGDSRWERDMIEELCRGIDSYPSVCVIFDATNPVLVPKSLLQRVHKIPPEAPAHHTGS